MLHFSRWKITLILLACTASLLFSLPNFVEPEKRFMLPGWLQGTVNLGLDLQGGSQLLLEVDFDAYLREQLQNLLDDTRTRLRAAHIGYLNLGVNEGKVKFDLRNASDAPKAEAALRKIDPKLTVSFNGAAAEVIFSEEWLTERKRLVLEQSLEIVGRRVDETGTREPIIQRQGENRVLLQVPGLSNPEHLKELLGRTARMTFHLLDESATEQMLQSGIVGPDTRIILGKETHNGVEIERKFAVLNKVELSGDMLIDAHATYDSQTNEPVVSFRFNAAGAQTFGKITTANVGKPFAVVLDNRVITAPVIRSPILGGSGIISGSFSVKEANDLALLLRAGALPAPLKVMEERSVGPSLGSDSIKAGANACLVAVGLVIMFMVACYGLFGAFATLAMVVNGFIVLALMSLLGATLTLPGIAGIVLTMGMAVDTNVLIYERMREEIRSGRPVHMAIENGFRMAFGTIIDSHITTLVAALLLFYFGTGTIKGFGVTLSIGIIASLFTAVLVTRLMIVTWFKYTRPSKLPI